MQEFLLNLAYGSAMVVVGMVVGRIITDKKWRDNADQAYRVYSKGGLYKVERVADLRED